MSELWAKSLALLKESIPAKNFDAWIKPLTLVEPVEGGRLSFWVESQFFADWVKNNYGALIAEALRKSGGQGDIAISFKVRSEGARQVAEAARQVQGPRVPASKPSQAKPRANPSAIPEQSNLDPTYTFDTFVVGSCNQLVHAAARRVAERPASSYNPLFIYGGVGLGKTHIMQAIGNQAKQTWPEMRVLYTNSEKFMTQLINSIRYDRMLAFKENFRSVDMLLVDDIQFIAGKERTQEEFFHTFNALFEEKKQIVVSSDRFPKDIEDLEERLRSRFGWGLVADIQPPELETRIAILNKKAAADNVLLTPDVASFLAHAIRENVRELEGALIRVGAFASLTGRPISLELAKEALRDIVKSQEKPVTIDEIQKAVSSYYKIRVTDMRSAKRARAISTPRQIAMFLCKELTNASYPEIGHHFGNRDHTTVLHAVRKIKQQRADDVGLSEELDILGAMLER